MGNRTVRVPLCTPSGNDKIDSKLSCTSTGCNISCHTISSGQSCPHNFCTHGDGEYQPVHVSADGRYEQDPPGERTRAEVGTANCPEPGCADDEEESGAVSGLRGGHQGAEVHAGARTEAAQGMSRGQ